MKTYIILKDGAEELFLKDNNMIDSKTIFTNGQNVTIESYDLFCCVNVPGIVRLFCIPENSYLSNYKNFINVTGNNKYNINNILKGSLHNTNIVVEGADGSGKTTLVTYFAQMGLLTQDRAVEEVTKSMKTYLSENERVARVEKYLRDNPSKNLVFLYLSDEDVLYDRVFSREVLDEFDKDAIISQRLYKDTYEKLKSYPNLFLVDCLNKTPEVIANEIIELTRPEQKTKKIPDFYLEEV